MYAQYGYISGYIQLGSCVCVRVRVGHPQLQLRRRRARDRPGRRHWHWLQTRAADQVLVAGERLRYVLIWLAEHAEVAS